MSTKYPVQVDCIRQVPPTALETEEEIPTDEAVHPEKTADSSDDEYDTDLEDDLTEEDSQDNNNLGREHYLTACKNLGLIPCTPFLRQIGKAEMNLKHYNLGSLGAEAVAVALMQNTKVLSVNIADNCIGADGAIYIAKMLTENPFITELSDA